MPQIKKLINPPDKILPKIDNMSFLNSAYGEMENEDDMTNILYSVIDVNGVQILTSELDSDSTDTISSRPRKRQRLDHLSQEEKVLRRKLKNRVAAQTARDRKKARMTELEDQVLELEFERKELLLENVALKVKNETLEKENIQLKQRLGLIDSDETNIPKENKSSAIDIGNKSVSSEKLDVVGSVEHASPINVPLPKGQDLPILALWMMQYVYLPTIARLMIYLLYSSSVVKTLCSVTSLTMGKQEKNLCQVYLPKWWGPHQNAWNPSKT